MKIERGTNVRGHEYIEVAIPRVMQSSSPEVMAIPECWRSDIRVRFTRIPIGAAWHGEHSIRINLCRGRSVVPGADLPVHLIGDLIDAILFPNSGNIGIDHAVMEVCRSSKKSPE